MAFRSVGRSTRAIKSLSFWVGLFRAFYVYKRPIRSLIYYLTNSGKYPFSCGIKTKKGTHYIELNSIHDLKVVNEIFCRRVYSIGDTNKINSALDIGGNAGLAALFFLTEYDAKKVYVYEPVPQNIEKIKTNLRKYINNVEIFQNAVGVNNRTADFGIEPFGQYGGLNKKIGDSFDASTQLIKDTITVHVVSINSVIQKHQNIDIIKIDTEGTELPLINSIQNKSSIKRIILDGCYNKGTISKLGYSEFNIEVGNGVTRIFSKPDSYVG